jgi:hypothetical protein
MEHRFNVQFAKDYGIEEAILIENLYFWIAKNVANGKHKHERRYWTYNSAKAFAELFPYINETKIYRVLAHLEDVEFIIKGKFSQDKHDRTNWYSFSDKGLSRLNAEKYDTINFSETFQNDDMDFTKMQNGTCKNANCIIINNTDNKQQIENKEEDIIISSKKNDYQAIIDCWNEYNGKSWGKVLRLGAKRKRIIKSALDNLGITQEELMRLFKTFPYADNWLFHPTKEHKDWKPDFDWWMRDTNGWLTKALEGKVHNANPQAFNEIMRNNGDEVLYTPQGRSIWFNEETKSYWSDDNFYYGVISDGYTDDNRPNGATITLNNGRGRIQWDAKSKEWIKQ